MAHQPIPDDPFRAPDQPFVANRAGEDVRRDSRLDNELQVDPELAEAPANGGKIAALAIALAVVLGAVFFGINHSSGDKPGTASTAQNTTQSSPPVAPPGMRDVTP